MTVENTNTLSDSLKSLSEMKQTENGALAYATEAIGNRWVEVFYGVSSFRQRNVVREDRKAKAKRLSGETDPLVKTFVDALEASQNFTDKSYGIRLSLLIRDVIAGCGERSLGRVLMTALADRNLVTAGKLIEVLGLKGYGRWDDLVEIASATKNKTLAKEIRESLIVQLKTDAAALDAGKKTELTLLAKWMPSISTSSSKTRKDARAFIEAMGISKKAYRQLLSRLRAALDIVERKLCAKEWEKIDYEKLPSLAALRYSGQFKAHDSERYAAYIQAVEKGEAKVNTSTLGAPEVMAKARKEDFPEATEALWKALPKITLTGNILPICDVSGSMWTSVGAIEAIDVSLALSLYLSEMNKGAFKGLVMSFSENPVISDTSGLTTLKAKTGKLLSECGYNTNIEKVLELLLELCKRKGVKREELPTLVFFSDMEFDQANYPRVEVETVFETYQRKFEEIGLMLPQVVFWNICNRTGTVPITKNKAGLVLCSGFSQHTLKAVVSGVYPTPWDMLKEQLDSPRYAGILDEEI